MRTLATIVATAAILAIFIAGAAQGQSACFPLADHERGLEATHGEKLAWSATVGDDVTNTQILRFYVNPQTRSWTLTLQPRMSVLVTCSMLSGFDFRSYPAVFDGRGA